MRQRIYPTERVQRRTWLTLVHTLLHLGVLLGGALGLPQAVASATGAALQDAQARGELTVTREAVRPKLVAAGESRAPDPAPSAHLKAAAPAPSPHRDIAARAQPVAFPAPLRSKYGAHPFQARAPPRTS